MSQAIDSAAWEAVIGLEVHAQLRTESKMFCGCPADYLGQAPNSNTCPVCLGLPGTLPVINQRAVEMTLRTALALNCEIPEFTKFDRKNYFYPDLPKGYQISQYDLPLSRRGHLEFQVEGRLCRAGITRVHLEEDTGTLHHEGDEIHTAAFSLVDLNRAGVPLMEIVGEPDLATPEEASAYLQALRQILIYIGVNDGNMEQGSLRCDANISMRRRGSSQLGVKVEIKNMNSFRSLRRALEFEVLRQVDVLEQGGTLIQETRGWSEGEQATVSQRTKEEAQEYRYFPEPDLPPLLVSREQVDELRSALPELPGAKRDRLSAAYSIPPKAAAQLSERAEDADYFEAVVRAGAPPREASNWQLVELMALCKLERIGPDESRVGPAQLAGLIALVRSGEISGSSGKKVLEECFATGEDPVEIVRRLGFRQVSDLDQLKAWVDAALEREPAAAADYRAGKKQALGRLVGAVMAMSRGQANGEMVSAMLQERLPQNGN